MAETVVEVQYEEICTIPQSEGLEQHCVILIKPKPHLDSGSDQSGSDMSGSGSGSGYSGNSGSQGSQTGSGQFKLGRKIIGRRKR